MKYSRILGTGSYLPKKVVTNEELSKTVETTDEWIVSRTGIRARHVANEEETSSYMGYHAGLRALEAAGLNANDIDMIIVATTTPDKGLPNTACLLQDRLGITGIPAFDITVACAGFVYALSVADQYIRTGMIKTILVVGVDALTAVTNWEDRSTCVLFGDGAGAVVLQAAENPGILSTHLHADGRQKDSLYIPSWLPGQCKKDEVPYISMDGRAVFRFAVKALEEVVEEALAANQMSQSAIDWLIPHQANLRIITALAEKLKLSLDKVVVTVDRHANTSAASVPMALDEAVRDGRIQRGHTLLLDAIGGGFVWGAALIVY
ncbi:MAG: 3-oxoacyl-(acyl-carrier-protein) synthase 3 [Gammaproteobacteria bacterium]|jgi:3-oxoacyl-[acyl-carrier-protein] synthase-3|nr:3-oxoacyl-(acyl-carrier-protein) synthase 3 [Gammaproteobacteria bacterium]